MCNKIKHQRTIRFQNIDSIWILLLSMGLNTHIYIHAQKFKKGGEEIDRYMNHSWFSTVKDQDLFFRSL